MAAVIGYPKIETLNQGIGRFFTSDFVNICDESRQYVEIFVI